MGNSFVSAAKNNKVAELKQLLAKGGVSLQDRVEAAFEAAGSGAAEAVDFLVSEGGVSVKSKGLSDWNLVMRAAERDAVNVLKVLVARGADVNYRTGMTGGALCVAAYAGRGNALRYLLEAGANPDIADGNGHSAIFAAFRGMHAELMPMLVEFGCNLDLQDRRGSVIADFSEPAGTMIAQGLALREKRKQKLALEMKASAEEEKATREMLAASAPAKSIVAVPSDQNPAYVNHLYVNSQQQPAGTSRDEAKPGLYLGGIAPGSAVATELDALVKSVRLLNFDDLKIGKALGGGSFGIAYASSWKGAPVVVKKPRQTDQFDFKPDDFLREAAFLERLGRHPNVVGFIGAVAAPHFCLVLELCANGTLEDALIAQKKFASDSADDVRRVIGLAADVATGLAYLHSDSIVHRDISARNILCTEMWRAKINDFGLSRTLGKDNSDGQTKSNIGPVRWMSPESLSDQTYSVKSDVWMYGVLLNELFARSEPYAGMPTLKIAMHVARFGNTLVMPPSCPRAINELFRRCTFTDPAARPAMKDVAARLQDILERNDIGPIGSAVAGSEVGAATGSASTASTTSGSAASVTASPPGGVPLTDSKQEIAKSESSSVVAVASTAASSESAVLTASRSEVKPAEPASASSTSQSSATPVLAQ